MRPVDAKHRYFTEFTISKALFYTVATIYVVSAAIVIVIQPFLTVPCENPLTKEEEPKTENVQFIYNPCRYQRFSVLLGLTIEECEFGRRLVWAVIFGCFIGWERKQADRPAGIRTMALVSLGSCLFGITSAFAFLSGPMAWDASRIAAAIPSGVGFLGSALIFKHKSDRQQHEVHGLTTAASVWLSAAVGIACSGGMYFIASYSTALMMVLLRFGPRTTVVDDEDEEEEMEGPNLYTTSPPAEGMNVTFATKTYASTSEMQALNPSIRSLQFKKRMGSTRPSLQP